MSDCLRGKSACSLHNPDNQTTFICGLMTAPRPRAVSCPPGDPRLKCGGPSDISLYELVATALEYIGCDRDANARLKLLATDPAMTPEMCRTAATNATHNHYALKARDGVGVRRAHARRRSCSSTNTAGPTHACGTNTGDVRRTWHPQLVW